MKNEGRVPTRGLLIAGLGILGLIAGLLGIVTLTRPEEQQGEQGFGLAEVSFGAACLFACVLAARIRRSDTASWARGTETAREILAGGLLTYAAIVGASAVEGLHSFTDELISAAPTFIAVGAWMLLVGGGWTRQLSAESRAPRYRSDTRTPSSGVIPSPLELGWAAALLTVADLVLGILWTAGATIETYDAILVFAPSPFVSFAFALLLAVGVVIAVSMLRVRRLASSEFAELGELPRQFILINALIVAACLVLPISPRSMDDVDFFLGACVPVLVSVLGLGLVGGFRTKLAEAIARLPDE